MTAQLAGMQLPTEFVESLSDTAFETLQDWLRDHAPPEVVSLHDHEEAMRTYVRAVASGRDMSKFGIVEVVANAAKHIAVMGGTFYGPDDAKYPCQAPAGEETDEAATIARLVARGWSATRAAELVRGPSQARAAEFAELLAQLDDAGLAEVEAEMRAQLVARGWSTKRIDELARGAGGPK